MPNAKLSILGFFALILGIILLFNIGALLPRPVCPYLANLAQWYVNWYLLIIIVCEIIVGLLILGGAIIFFANINTGETLSKIIMGIVMVIIIVMLGGLLYSFGTFSGSNILGTACIAASGYLCQYPIYYGASGNIIVTLGQNTGNSWNTANFVFVAQGTPTTSSGRPRINFNGIADGGSADSLPSGLGSGQSESIDLPATPSTAVCSQVTGAIWVKYTTNQSSAAQYAQIASLNVKATGGKASTITTFTTTSSTSVTSSTSTSSTSTSTTTTSTTTTTILLREIPGTCTATAGYLCQNPTYLPDIGNIMVTLGQDTGTNWTGANFMFVPHGQASYQEIGIPVTMTFIGFTAGLGNISDSAIGLKSNQFTTVLLPVNAFSFNRTNAGMPLTGTIWAQYETTPFGGGVQYANMTSIIVNTTSSAAFYINRTAIAFSNTGCIGTSASYSCQNVIYSRVLANIIVVLGQDTGSNWATANFIFVPNGQAYNTGGLPVTLTTAGIAAGGNTISAKRGMAMHTPIAVTLPVNGISPFISVGTPATGTIWAQYTTVQNSTFQYAKMALVNTKAT